MDLMQKKFEDFGKNPRIWYRIPGYIIRNYSPDLEESILYHMLTHFVVEEPFLSNSNVASDPVSVSEVREFWRKIVTNKQNLTVIALKEGSPGSDLKPIKENRIDLAGLNILCISFKDDPNATKVEDFSFQGIPAKKAVGTFFDIAKRINMYERFKVNKFMDAAGFSVHPNERKKGLGDALLKSRLIICKELGIPVTKTVFSSIPAQKVALRCGFEIAEEIFYGELKDEDGNLRFPAIPTTNRVLTTYKIIQ